MRTIFHGQWNPVQHILQRCCWLRVSHWRCCSRPDSQRTNRCTCTQARHRVVECLNRVPQCVEHNYNSHEDCGSLEGGACHEEVHITFHIEVVSLVVGFQGGRLGSKEVCIKLNKRAWIIIVLCKKKKLMVFTIFLESIGFHETRT